MPAKPSVVKDDYHEAMLCRNCGFCCTLSPQLNDFDIARIKKVGFLEEFFVKRNIEGLHYMKQDDGRCVFLKIENVRGNVKTKTDGAENIYCEIYSDRPTACRIYPSYDHEIKECPNKGKSWRSAKDDPFLKPILAFRKDG